MFRLNQSRTNVWNLRMQWALKAFPRKRFPGALFSRTSHRRPSRRNHPPPNPLYQPPISPHPLKLSLFHFGYSLVDILIITIAIIANVTIYIRVRAFLHCLYAFLKIISLSSLGFFKKINNPMGGIDKIPWNLTPR